MVSSPSDAGNLTAAAVRVCVGGLLLLVLAGCESMAFYSQAVRGQWMVLSRAEPVSEVMAAPDTDATTRKQLALTQRALEFAEQHLTLEVGKRYRRYTALQDSAVVWNVFAAQPLNLSGRRWCYPIAGCTSYRGFFREAAAREYAGRLKDSGWEVYVGAVPAYSTLGWFDDPLLSTFIHWPEPDLVNLLFHELAHTRVWVKDDVAFNESFASFVGARGMRDWLQRENRQVLSEDYRRRAADGRRLQQLVLKAKSELNRVYTLDVSDEEKLTRKSALMAALRNCYARNRDQLGGGRFDRLVHDEFNNAYLVSVGTYNNFVPVFRALYDQAEGWADFFDRVDTLADLPVDERNDALSGLQDEIGEHADDSGADEIDCSAFPGHGAD